MENDLTVHLSLDSLDAERAVFAGEVIGAGAGPYRLEVPRVAWEQLGGPPRLFVPLRTQLELPAFQ